MNSIDISLHGIRELTRINTINRWELMRYNGSPVKVTLNTQWHTAADAHEITLSIGTRYTTVRNMISRLLIDYNIELTFATSGDDNELYTGTIGRSPSLPPQLATVMLSVGIGSLRGMMASRTAGSMLARYPLPIINVSELVSHIAYGSMPAANSVPLSGLIYE